LSTNTFALIFVRTLILLPVSLMFAACEEGVKSGSVVSSFTGVQEVEVISPTAVQLSWEKNEKVINYEVFSNFQTEPLVEQVFEKAVISDLSPNSEYTFKVLGYETDGKVLGGNKEIKVTTWSDFEGITNLEFDENENMVVSWDYPHPADFLVYYKKMEEPSSENTNEWSTVNVTVSDEQTATLKGLEKSTRYYVTVHVKFQNGGVTRPEKTLSLETNSTIPMPTYDLPKISIGNLPFMTVAPVVNTLFTGTAYTSRVSRDGEFLTAPLVGPGTLLFSSTGGSPTPGIVDNITLEVNYNDGILDETIFITSLNTYIKDQDSFIDAPPYLEGFEQTPGAAYLGDAMASGDFNCDGYEDLAVGLSRASMGTFGIRQPEVGAIAIYYSYRKPDTTYELKTDMTPTLNPVNPGVDPQIITFDDMSGYADFGASMASGGNLNGDRLGLQPCEDLIVGAPAEWKTGGNGASSRRGFAYVFFGSREGLVASPHVDDLAENVETCDGLLEEATCAPVRLWPNHDLWPTSLFGGLPYSATNQFNNDRFGAAVSFIGDVNADGYDDIAIGAPNGDWDGVADASVPDGYVRDVGYVAIYFGSRYGIGYETPEATGVPTANDERFRFLKIYPPVVEESMLFGSSIAGGADVDGYYPVESPSGDYHGGSDFVVGAPGFKYRDPDSNLVQMDGTAGFPPSNNGWNRTPGVFNQPISDFGVNQVDNTSKGIAFLYFGRGGQNAPSSVETPSRKSYWDCRVRGSMAANEHYSCLPTSNTVRWLFPRDPSATGFGSAVAMLGNKTFYDSNNNEIVTKSDPNQDGFAEIIVSAPDGDGVNANTGHLWQYFGNKSRLYEGGDFQLANINSDSTSDGEWISNNPQCDSFLDGVAATLEKCAPTVLRPNSVPVGARLGHRAESFAVGDVTGDGVDDLIVGAEYDNIRGTQSGAVYSFVSSVNNGVNTIFKKFYDNMGDSNDNLGYAVAVGNFNGDFSNGSVSAMDIAAGAPNDEQERPGGGAAHLFLTSSGAPLPSLKANSEIKLYDTQASTQNFGHNLTQIIGDINGDSYDDAVGRMTTVGADGAVVFNGVIYFGSPSGLVTSQFCRNKADLIFEDGATNTANCYPSISPSNVGLKPGHRFPQLILKPLNLANEWAELALGAGDVNKDGFDDVYFIDQGTSIALYFGSGGGLSAASPPSWRPSQGNPQLVTRNLTPNGFIPNGFTCEFCNQSTIRTNKIPVRHGDLNGDGFEDLVIANPNAASLPMNLNAAAPTLPPGDGYSPATIGAGLGWQCDDTSTPSTLISECENGQRITGHGAVYIFYGSVGGLQTPSSTGVAQEGDDLDTTNAFHVTESYGSESSDPIKACDGDENQTCRVQILRNPVFENIHYGFQKLDHHFGSGFEVYDWNNDGIDDLVVGSPGFEDLRCYDETDVTSSTYKRNYGRLFLFRGSNRGLVAGDAKDYYMNYNSSQSCPSLLINPSYDDVALGVASLGSAQVRAIMPPITDENLNRTDRYFGWRMSVAGDVNNDGAEDLVISSSTEDNSVNTNSGTSYIFYGPLCGADNEPALLAVTQGLSNFNRQLLWTNPDDLVTLAGINFGSDCQVNGSPKLPMQKFQVIGSESSERYGDSTFGRRKTKGDVNLDGFDDFFIGSHLADSKTGTTANVGQGVIFFGSAKGLFTNDFPSATVVTNQDKTLRPYALEPKHQFTNMKAFEYGFSGGDVNGDGSVDYLIPTREFDSDGVVSGINLGGFIMFY